MYIMLLSLLFNMLVYLEYFIIINILVFSQIHFGHISKYKLLVSKQNDSPL